MNVLRHGDTVVEWKTVCSKASELQFRHFELKQTITYTEALGKVVQAFFNGNFTIDDLDGLVLNVMAPVMGETA